MEAFRKHSIIIIEDDTQTRLHLEHIVQNHNQLEWVGSATNCAEAKVLLQKTPDIALVDLGLPDGHGSDLMRQFFSVDGGTYFIVMTVFGDDQHVIPALEAGASGYLLKETSDSEVGQMISMLIDGGSPISPIIARKLLKRFHHQPESTKSNPLSKREFDVLKLMSKGFSYHETASMLHISYHTVITHVKSIYRKLAVNSRAEAIYEAVQTGLLDMKKS